MNAVQVSLELSSLSLTFFESLLDFEVVLELRIKLKTLLKILAKICPFYSRNTE